MKAKKIIILTLLIILPMQYFTYCALWRVDIAASTQVEYLSEYRQYYYATRSVNRWALFGYATRQIIYFKPGLKGKMVAKLKEDVTKSLEALIAEHGDIFYRYEISDDFMQVRIYEVSGGMGEYGFYDVSPGTIKRIKSLIALYHSIKGGHSIATDNVIRLIEPESIEPDD